MTTTSLLEKEVRTALSSKSSQAVACKELDRLCREIQQRKSFSVFYACFVEIMSTSFCTVKNDYASAWINAIPQQCHDLFTPNEGPIFDLVFLFATFPRTPIDFPVHFLPASTQRALQRPGGSRDQGLSPLYSNKVFRGAGKTLSMEFSIYEYFFYAFTVHPLLTPQSSVSSSSALPPSTSFAPFGIQKPLAAGVSGAESYQRLLQEYLDHFFSYSYGPEETRVRLQYYLTDNPRLSNPSTAYVSGPQVLRERAKEFLLIISEFWFGPNLDIEELNELNYAKPSLPLLVSIQRFVGHLVLHPAMQCNRLQEEPWSMPGEFRVIRPALFALLRITFKCHEGWDDSLTKVVEMWQYVLEPWKYELVQFAGKSEVRPRPPSASSKYSQAWKPYLVANMGFYTTALVDFLELVSTLDFSSSEKQRLPLLKQVAGVLAVFTDESKTGGASLISALHELEKLMYFNNPVSQREVQTSKVLREEYAQLSQRHLPRGFQHYRALVQSSLSEKEQYKTWIGKFITIPPKVAANSSSRPSPSFSSSVPRSSLSSAWSRVASFAHKSPSAAPSTTAVTFQEEMLRIEERMRAVFAIADPVVPLFRDITRSVPKQKVLAEPKWWHNALPFLAPGFVYVRESYNPESHGRLSDCDRELLLSGKLVCSKLDVPSWGSAWDRPVGEGESTLALLALKALSQLLNTWYFTYLDLQRTVDFPSAIRNDKIAQIVLEGEGPVNLRGLASYKSLLFFAMLLCLLYLVCLR